MGRHRKTITIIEEAHRLLTEHHPMTLRQLYYRLVSGQVIENTRGEYQGVSNALVYARQEGRIPWEWIEDRLRRPRAVSMWGGLSDFAETAQAAYRREVWETQPFYLECWLEKDALSGIFEEILEGYGVTLNVGRGYDGWSSIYNAARRFDNGKSMWVLYWGDFDPSGEDMVRSLRERLGFFGCQPEIVKCALTCGDVQRYKLPPDFTKTTDTRRQAFIERYGDVAVELDALPMEVLKTRLHDEVEDRMDMRELGAVREREAAERARLKHALRALDQPRADHEQEKES